MKHCPLCNGILKREEKKTFYIYKDESREIVQSGDYCTECGEGYLSSQDIKNKWGQATLIKLPRANQSSLVVKRWN